MFSGIRRLSLSPTTWRHRSTVWPISRPAGTTTELPSAYFVLPGLSVWFLSTIMIENVLQVIILTWMGLLPPPS